MNTTKLKDRHQQERERLKQDPEWQKLLAHLRWCVQIEKKVGDTPPDRLGWAVKFAQQNLDDLTPGEWTDTAAQLRAFCNFPFAAVVHPHLPEHPLVNIDEWPTRGLTESDIRAVHREYQKFVEVLVIDKWADTGDLTIGVTVHLTQDPEYPERSKVSVVARTDDVVTKAMWALVTLLTAYGDRLRQCPECRQFFVASRTNQEFCAYRCASRKSTRAYRQRQDQPKRGRKGGTTR